MSDNLPTLVLLRKRLMFFKTNIFFTFGVGMLLGIFDPYFIRNRSMSALIFADFGAYLFVLYLNEPR